MAAGRRLMAALSLVVVAGACGDSGGGAGTTPAPTTSLAPSTTSTTVPATTAPPTTSTTTTTTLASTTTTVPPTTTTSVAAASAQADLAAFFTAAEALDADIAAAAEAFNAGFDPDGPDEIISTEAIIAVQPLSTAPVADAIPAGLAPDLEAAVLAVFADLDSRIAALRGATERLQFDGPVDDALLCLGFGSTSNARFDDDLARARTLAATAPAPTAAADSKEAGILSVRLELIRLLDVGCDSCGGATYDEPFSVDWEGRTIEGVEFTASFDGARWVVEIFAC